MAYSFDPYGYYGQPAPDQLAQLRQNQQFQAQQMRQAQCNMIWINSEAEAMAYMVAPNCAVALWDTNNPLVYLKQADSSGRPSFKAFEIRERVLRPQQSAPEQNTAATEYASLERLQALEQKVDSLLKKNEEEENG